MAREWLDKGESVEVKGLPDFSDILGCLSDDRKHVHIGQLFTRRTACGRPMGDTILSRDITVTCPDCVAEIKYRSEHVEAACKPMGMVTHKGA